MIRRALATFAEESSRPEMALARHVVHLDPDAVGILEEDRVVAGRELRQLGRMDDVGLELVDEEAMDLVDVLAAAGAKAEMVEPGAILVEATAVAVLGEPPARGCRYGSRCNR